MKRPSLKSCYNMKEFNNDPLIQNHVTSFFLEQFDQSSMFLSREPNLNGSLSGDHIDMYIEQSVFVTCILY